MCTDLAPSIWLQSRIRYSQTWARAAAMAKRHASTSSEQPASKKTKMTPGLHARSPSSAEQPVFSGASSGSGSVMPIATAYLEPAEESAARAVQPGTVSEGSAIKSVATDQTTLVEQVQQLGYYPQRFKTSTPEQR
jgi:hypothetical protein